MRHNIGKYKMENKHLIQNESDRQHHLNENEPLDRNYLYLINQYKVKRIDTTSVHLIYLLISSFVQIYGNLFKLYL